MTIPITVRFNRFLSSEGPDRQGLQKAKRVLYELVNSACLRTLGVQYEYAQIRRTRGTLYNSNTVKAIKMSI